MYKAQQYVITIFLMFFIASCATTEESGTVRTTESYGSGVIQHPVIGELEVNTEKVTGESTTTSGESVSNLKGDALRDAKQKSHAHVIVDPSFDVEASGRDRTVQVTGFPATYTNFRPVTDDDLPLIEAGELSTADVLEVGREEESNGNRSGRALILGAMGLVTAIAIIQSAE